MARRKPSKAPPHSQSKTDGRRPVELLERHAGKLALLFVLIATLRIVAVYPVYNHTIDEPAHIACGMEWLEKGTYRLEDQHPPLARVAAALGPRLAGAHLWGREGIYNEGAAILYAGGQYDHVLTLARVGILPFFWLACGVVFVWMRRWVDPASAALSVFLLSSLPPVLAHAGLATTDMAFTAAFGCAVVGALFWLERPSGRRAVAFGVGAAAMVLSKFSALVFFPAFAAAFLVLLTATGQRPKLSFPTLGLAIGVGAALVWAGYRFSFGPGPWGFPLPAPDFFSGLGTVREHNRTGHPAYLLGQMSKDGWWYYYFVALAVKTPLPLLALSGLGFAVAWRRRIPALMAAVAVVAGILLVSMFSSINIGVRHILPVYLGMCALGGAAASRLLDGNTAAQWTVGGLLAVYACGGAVSHPDYLPYFNLLAGDRPEEILADSDLDWGQDMKRLSVRLGEVGATSVSFNPLISAHLEAVHGFPPIQPTDPLAPSPGWNAVSLTVLKVARLGLYFDQPKAKLWPDSYKPTERVGRGVLLYYFPPRLFQQVPK